MCGMAIAVSCGLYSLQFFLSEYLCYVDGLKIWTRNRDALIHTQTSITSGLIILFVFAEAMFDVVWKDDVEVKLTFSSLWRSFPRA